jgi:predicted methyltransferase
MKKSSLLIAVLVAVSACSKQEPAAQAPAAETAATAQDALVTSVNSQTRSAEDKARDQYRHPQEALTFWGLQPGMTILEVQPGGGWWTEILAPYAHATGGKYYATAADLDNPKLLKVRARAAPTSKRVSPPSRKCTGRYSS